MINIALVLSYNGHKFGGWQRQKHCGNTVQQYLEEAISIVANQDITVVCAGRTDAGVSATSQVVNFMTDAVRSERNWVLGINANLPPDIRVHNSVVVDNEFSARFSAKARKYMYVISNTNVQPCFLPKNITFVSRKINVAPMIAASTYLLGEHDFTSFRSSGCQSLSAMRNMQEISIKQINHLIIITIQANAFLYNMVRNIVGSLLLIGHGDKEPIWLQKVLHGRSRELAGPTAAPNGLYLCDVIYSEQYAIKNNVQHELLFLS